MRLMRTLWPVTLCVLFVTISTPVAGAGRVYDKDVEKLIDQASKGLNKFIGSMTGDAKGAKITRDGVEYDVSDSLADLKSEGARLGERFSGDAMAAPTALAFLQKAMVIDGFLGRHPNWSGADQEWQALRPTLVSLAEAYQIDWSASPDSWQARRSSDAELAGWAKQLDQDIKTYASALGQSAKDAKVDKAARAALDGQVKALAGGTKSLQKALSSRVPAAAAFDSLSRSLASVSEQAAKLGLADGTAQASGSLEATMLKIASGLGIGTAAGT